MKREISRVCLMLELPKPYLLFLGAETETSHIKTALGLKDWIPGDCCAQWRLPGATVSTGLPDMTPATAVAAGARALVIGVAASGGRVREEWVAPIVEAMAAGLDIVSGLHEPLGNNTRIAAAALRYRRQLIDIRRPGPQPIGTGLPRRGKRLLTVGTDCALGKKYTALALTAAFREAGCDASFRATGQTGILIAGSGIPIDAVVADFISGAAEALSPDAAPDHWDIIEGQGSLFHPSFAAVTLGLLHGSQPDILVLCHQPGRTAIIDCADFALPSLASAIESYLGAARLTNAAVRCAGISLNTSLLDEAAALQALARASAETGLPAADPIRGLGLAALVRACLGTA